MHLMFAALMLQAAPDLDDPFNRALADWAACIRWQTDVAATSSNRRDIGVVDEAMTRCTAEEAELRERVRAQSGESAYVETMRQIVGRVRVAMHRHLRRHHRR